MQKTKYLVVILSIAFVMVSELSAFGTLDHGESCDPTPSQTDESMKCDTSKRLSCDTASLVCECHHEGRDIFDGDSGRCETKAGKFCAGDNVYPTICVDNAICNKTTNFCECEEGFVMDPEGNECSGGININAESNIFMSSLAMFLLLISVFICT